MFFRLLKYSFNNISRNAFLSFSSILVLTLLMFFINILLLVHDVSLKIIDGINEKLTISLYLRDGYDKNSGEVIGLLGDIKNNFPNIETTYKTKEEVLDEIRENDPDLVKILERQNPLPETMELTNIDLEQFDALNSVIQSKASILSQPKEWDKDYFASYGEQYDRINSVINVLKTLQVGLYIIIWVFLFSIAIITYSIIGNFIYYYKNEIYITRLVWGSKIFIYGPFGLQGAIYSTIAFIISAALFFWFIKSIELLFGTTLNDTQLMSNLKVVMAIELVLIAFIGWVSWFISSRKYLK